MQGSNSKIFKLEEFVYDEEKDEYICPAGRSLPFTYEKISKEEYVYQSESCAGCPLAAKCLRTPGANRALRVTKHLEVVQEMRKRLETPWAKLMIKWRGQTIELLFAWLKALRRLQQFTFRDKSEVNDEWKFEAAAVNVFRLAIGRSAEA